VTIQDFLLNTDQFVTQADLWL